MSVYQPIKNMPRQYTSISLFFLLILFLSSVCLAQRPNSRNRVSFGQSVGITGDSSFLDVDQDIAVQLMPFDELVRMAVANSPILKYQNEIVSSLNSERDLAKVQVLQNASGFASYSGGNQSLVTTGINQRGDQLGQIANGYRLGVDLRVSLYDLFGRKHQIKRADAVYRSSMAQKDVYALQVRREMITVYQDMITAQQVLKLRLTDEQSAMTALRIAENENQKGQSTSEAFSMATNRYVEAKVITETVKGDFIKQVHQFEALVGVPIQRMKRF